MPTPSSTPPPAPITLLRLKRPRSPPPHALHLQLPSSKRPRLSSLTLHSAHVSFHQLPVAPTITSQISVIDLTPSDLVRLPNRKRSAPASDAIPPPATRHKHLQSQSQHMTCNGVPMARQPCPSTPDEAWYIADTQRSDMGLAPLSESSMPRAVHGLSDSDSPVYVRMDSSRIPWLSLQDSSDSDHWEDDSDGEGSVDYPSTPASSDNEDQQDDHDDDSEHDHELRMPFGYHGMSTWPMNQSFHRDDDQTHGQDGTDDESQS